jgi:hypothetical protein
MNTLNNEIQKDFKELFSDPKYLDFIKEKDIDLKLFKHFFDALINTRNIIGENEENIDDARISLMNNIKNTFLNLQQ